MQQNNLKVTIELDLANESDRKLIELIQKFKAAEARGLNPSLVNTAAEVSNEAPIASANALIQSGQELTKAANDLGDKLPGEPRKLTPKERARVAAKARWAREKARKEGKPLPPTAREKKKKLKATSDTHDYSRAREVPLQNFQQEEMLEQRHSSVLSALMRPAPSVDGREIMDGSWQHREDHQHYVNGQDPDPELEYDNPLDDEYVRSVHERASKFD